MNPLRTSALALGLAALSGPGATARGLEGLGDHALIFSSLGPKGHLYSITQGWSETGAATPNGAASVAFRFPVTNGSYRLTEVDLPLIRHSQYGRGHSFTFVVAESVDNHPGAAIFQQQLTHGFLKGGRCCRLVKILPTKAVTLLKGHYYWLVTLPTPTTDGLWAIVSTGKNGTQSVSSDGGKTWSGGESELGGAFAVYGTPAGG